VAVKVGPSGAVAGVDLNPGMLTAARSLPTTKDAALVGLVALGIPMRFVAYGQPSR